MISNPSVLDVLTYMFDYLFESHNEINDNDIKAYLSDMGFDEKGINKALTWLDNIATLPDNIQPITHANFSIRLYNKDEQAKIDLNSRDFLYFLQNVGQINQTQRELIINQAMSLESNQLVLEDIKWITIMVLGNDINQSVNDEWLNAIISDSKDITLQ